MVRSSKRFLLLLLALAVSLPAFGQYKCRSASGSLLFSDVPCPAGSRQEQATYNNSSAREYAAQDSPGQAKSSDARLLDAKVAEAVGSGDLGRAKGLALTPEHWRMISEAEQRNRQPVMGRTDADLRADAKSSPECKSAQRSYENEASSIKQNGAAINAAKRTMYSACGMVEPTVVENRTVINDNRRIVAPPPPAQLPMNCRQLAGGRLDCW